MDGATDPVGKKAHGSVTLSVVVPLYNESAVLPHFYRLLGQVLADLPESCEIVLVDDGSSDATFAVIKQLAAADPRVVGVRFSRNFGKEAAMLAGLEQAAGQAVIIMDGDGQHPPELLPAMVDVWRRGEAEVVAAVKRGRAIDGVVARWRAKLFNRLMTKVTGLDLVGGSDYQLLDRQAVTAILAMRERIRFFRGMAQWVGFRRHSLYFDVAERLAGTGRWTMIGLLRLALTAITSFTAQPLAWIMGVGAGGLVVALVLVLQALYSWLVGAAVSGWTSLVIMILFFGSLNLFAVGVLGEYLGQVYQEVKGRPVYLVRELVRADIAQARQLQARR